MSDHAEPTVVSSRNRLADDPKARFAAVILVGPDVLEMWRTTALIESLLRWEPDLGWCVIVDDTDQPRGLSELQIFPSTCRAVTLMNPGYGRRGDEWGRVWAGLMTALQWVHDHTTADFVLKFDADVLVTAPFAETVRGFMRRTPSAGMFGSLGYSCNRERRALQDLSREPKLLRAYRLVPPAPPADSPEASAADEPIEIQLLGWFGIEQRRAFDRIRPHIEAAVRHGYASSEYNEGGAYAVNRLMIDRMADAGYLERPDLWLDLHFGEDKTMAMYARAVGLEVLDFSDAGEPFGIQHIGLPYSLDELVARGYSIIHSVRNDPRHSEHEVREFFRQRAAQSSVRPRSQPAATR